MGCHRRRKEQYRDTQITRLADSFEIIILSVIGQLVACDFPMQRWQNALLTSVVFLAMMIGCPVFGAVADIWGRKKSIAASVILLFLFGAFSALSPNYIWMVILRTLLGFALGGVAQGLTICSEYSPSNIRGKAGFYLCYFWSFGTIGVILMTWLIMEYFDSWRILLVAVSVPGLLVIISLKWYPESARYFLVSNQYDRALQVLQQMASMNGKDLPPGSLARVSECTKRGRLLDLLGSEYRRTTLLFWYICLAVASGYYGIALISPTIIQKGSLRLATSNESLNFYKEMITTVSCVKYTKQNYIDLLWTSAAEFPGLIIFSVLIEHMSRKVLLSSTCVISAILIFFLLIETEHEILTLLFLFGARAVILADFQLIYIMTSEAFPTTLRAIAMGSGSAFCRLGGLAVPYLAQVLVIENPVATICVLGGMVLMAGVAAVFLPMETRGKDMMESHSS